MKKLMLGLWSLCLFACNERQPEQTHPAYHNPVVQPFTDSITEHPDAAHWYYLRAQALIQIKQDSLSLLDAIRAFQLDSLNPDYAQALGFIHLQLDQPEAAVTAFKQRLKLIPGDARTNLLLSRAYLQANDTVAAQAAVQKVLNTAPNYPDALYWLAQIKAAQRDTTSAIAFTKLALKADPKYYDAAYQLAGYYRALGDEQAVQQYQYTFTLDTLNADPLYEIGYFYEQQMEWAKAKAAYHTCLMCDRDYTDAYIQTGKILLHQDSAVKAIRIFDLAIRSAPNSAEAYYQKGRAFEKAGLRDSAVNAYRQALVFKQDFTEAEAALKNQER